MSEILSIAPITNVRCNQKKEIDFYLNFDNISNEFCVKKAM